MKFWVIDTETTGIGPEDKAVEVAGLLIDEFGKVYKSVEQVLDPGIPIPPIASSIHHLTDELVLGKPALTDVLHLFNDEEYDYVVAHNAKFDQVYLPLDKPWICTWKCALRLFPEAPSYSNQVLRYWLRLPVVERGGHAHRALYDVEVTTQLFYRMLSMATTEAPWVGMAKLTEIPALLRKVNFGVHKDKLWSEVPRSYLNFILFKSSGWDENILHTANYWYERTQ